MEVRKSGAEKQVIVLSLPFTVGRCKIHSIGKIDSSRPSFHSTLYLYPIGFRSSCLYSSALKDALVEYSCEILDSEEKPIFRITPSDWPQGMCEAHSVDEVWCNMEEKVIQRRARRNQKLPDKVISAVSLFGLDDRKDIVPSVLENLSGAAECKNYKMRTPRLFRIAQSRSNEVESKSKNQIMERKHREGLRSDDNSRKKMKGNPSEISQKSSVEDDGKRAMSPYVIVPISPINERAQRNLRRNARVRKEESVLSDNDSGEKKGKGNGWKEKMKFLTASRSLLLESEGEEKVAYVVGKNARNDLNKSMKEVLKTSLSRNERDDLVNSIYDSISECIEKAGEANRKLMKRKDEFVSICQRYATVREDVVDVECTYEKTEEEPLLPMRKSKKSYKELLRKSKRVLEQLDGEISELDKMIKDTVSWGNEAENGMKFMKKMERSRAIVSGVKKKIFVAENDLLKSIEDRGFSRARKEARKKRIKNGVAYTSDDDCDADLTYSENAVKVKRDQVRRLMDVVRRLIEHGVVEVLDEKAVKRNWEKYGGDEKLL